MITHKTACILCSRNCGLEIDIEDGRFTKVRGDDETLAWESVGWRAVRTGRWKATWFARPFGPVRRIIHGLWFR